MTAETRRAILIGVMLAMLVIAAAWNVLWMLEQRETARRAAQDLADCKALAGRIKALRDAPAVASVEVMGVQELGQRIEAASRRAGLAQDALEGVLPQSPRRVGNTPYVRKPTVLTLRGVTLHQVAMFLHHLTADSELSVRDLRLRIPHGDAPRDVWDAETTLTYLMYVPTATAARDS